MLLLQPFLPPLPVIVLIFFSLRRTEQHVPVTTYVSGEQYLSKQYNYSR